MERPGWPIRPKVGFDGDGGICTTDPSEDISFKGVVFNEMKGVYSQPDSLLGRATQQALFPENTYGVDSGGDPKVIPKLTFDEFKEFHQKYYHPNNARIWFYGDDDPSERLRLLSGAILGDPWI